jgi:ABC-type multidrug transport system ATPase subunit
LAALPDDLPDPKCQATRLDASPFADMDLKPSPAPNSPPLPTGNWPQPGPFPVSREEPSRDVGRLPDKERMQGFTTVRIARQTTILGRDKNCDLVLENPNVSRRHAQLTRNGGQVTIEDLGSSNGTFVQGKRITGSRILRPGDFVRIGSFTLKVMPDGNLEQRDFRGNISIEVQGVAVEVQGRRLLDDVSLTIYPSELVALMGPSGAGKTTLMNALNGYTPPTAGRVLFNGRDLYAHYAEFQGMVGYVPQDDIMHRNLTVGQALYYTARLRLPRDYSRKEIRTRIETVVGQLGLYGTENVLIGSPEKKSLSGGQRKRLNLAIELLTDPAVLFLDEPTSGLSSEDALMVMKLLRRLADGGKTIIISIHQPSLEAYRLVDNLILVSKDFKSAGAGRLVYYGPAYPQAVEFFNPGGVPGLKLGAEPTPDAVLKGLDAEHTLMAFWLDRFNASPLKRHFIEERSGHSPIDADQANELKTHRAFGFGQLWALVARCLAIKLRDSANTAILLAQAPIIALLVVFVFGKQTALKATVENWPTVAGASSVTVFLLALAALWFGCFNSVREIVGEWAVFQRERMINLKIPSYVGSKFMVLGGLCCVQCGVLLGIVHWGAALKGPWLPMFAMLLLTSLVGLSIGLTMSSLARTSEVAVALLPLILLPMVIFAGVLQPLHEMDRPMKWLAETMPSRWAFQGLLLQEAEHRSKWIQPAPPGAAAPVGEPHKPQAMAERYFPGIDGGTGIAASVAVLTTMLALLVACIHFILKFRDVHLSRKVPH